MPENVQLTCSMSVKGGILPGFQVAGISRRLEVHDLSRNLGLDLASMQNEAVPVGLRNLGPCKFKKVGATADEELTLSRVLATRAVELVIPSVPASVRSLLPSASDIRELILREGAPWVHLSALVDYCWSVGLPVLHVSAFPPKAKKMDGLASTKSGHYGIVLCKNVKRTSDSLSKNGHAIRLCTKPSQGDSSLRHTRIGFPCIFKSIWHSPSTTSASRR